MARSAKQYGSSRGAPSSWWFSLSTWPAPSGMVSGIAFIAITFWDRFLRSRTPRLFRPFATSAVLVAVLTFSVHSLRTFHFRPIEAWRATARTIENHFPKGTEIVVQFRPQWLKAYLSADYPLTPNFDAPKFLAGEQIVVDPSFDPKAHFPVRDLPKGYLMKAVPQRRGGMQKIYFAPR